MPSSSRTALVEDLMGRFPEVPREAVIKEDLLRGGMAFDESALSGSIGGATGEVKPKSYFIFSFDHRTLPELGAAALNRPPEEIVLTGGPYDLRRTVVSVRVNPDSPTSCAVARTARSASTSTGRGSRTSGCRRCRSTTATSCPTASR